MVMENLKEIEMSNQIKKEIMWFILNNKDPTWDVLQKRSFFVLFWMVNSMPQSRRNKFTYHYVLLFYKISGERRGEDDSGPKCLVR
jgi:hypothetical protein